MSQGLTWIAGRRTPLLALVALFALAVGMFARSAVTLQRRCLPRRTFCAHHRWLRDTAYGSRLDVKTSTSGVADRQLRNKAQ